MAVNTIKEDSSSNAPSPLIQIDSQDRGSLLFPYLDVSPDPALESEGWSRRFMIGPDRKEEANQLYLELGFEVHNEPVKPTASNEICRVCETIACKDYVIIYTRKLDRPNSESK